MKTLKVKEGTTCIGCQMCALACSRKLGKGVSLSESYIKVTKGSDDNFNVSIDLGKMTPELAEYVVKYCPIKILEVSDEG